MDAKPCVWLWHLAQSLAWQEWAGDTALMVCLPMQSPVPVSVSPLAWTPGGNGSHALGSGHLWHQQSPAPASASPLVWTPAWWGTLAVWRNGECHPNCECDHVAVRDPNGACSLGIMGLPMHLLGCLPLWPHGEMVSATPTSTAIVLPPETPTAHAHSAMWDCLCTCSAVSHSGRVAKWQAPP